MQVRSVNVDEIPLGTTLLRKREEAGLSLEDVSKKTRIKINYLESIEKCDLHKLPCLPFNRGFVRAYASAVGVDPNSAAERFNLEMGLEG